MARFCPRPRRHATRVSRFQGDARLYAPVPKRRRRTGRPPQKGRKLPAPQQGVARRVLTPATVPWYGGGDRRVQRATDTGLGYKAGAGVVPIRWVFVRDVQGTHRNEYFYTTDPALTGPQRVRWFTARWPIETTFQEVRAPLGFETPRQRVAPSVLRTAPCLLGLFRVICLIYAEHVQSHPLGLRRTLGYVKEEPTFSEAMATVRRLFWREILWQQPSQRSGFPKLPPKIRTWMLDRLCQAA